MSPGCGRPSKKKGSTNGFSRKGNYRHKYSPEMISQALQLVSDKTLTLNAAAKKYGIPKTTLFDRLRIGLRRLGAPLFSLKMRRQSSWSGWWY
jgi:hypothetical protein